MFFKLTILAVIVFVQGNFALGQQQQQQQQPYSGMPSTQMWDPSVWTPYFNAAANAWKGYMDKTQDASAQLYKQWDQTGAGRNWFNMGMQMAQQANKAAQKYAAMASMQAQKYAEEAAKEAAKYLPGGF